MAFDVEKLTIIGNPVTVVRDLLVDPEWETPYFAVSENGTLVYASGSSLYGESSLVWVDRRGSEEEITKTRGVYGQPRLSPDGTRIVSRTTGGDRNVDIWV